MTMMLRNTRSFLISSSRAVASPKSIASWAPRPHLRTAVTATKFNSTYPRAPISRKPSPIQTTSYVTKTPSGFQQGTDPEEDKRIGQRKLESNPEVVTTESSVRHFYESSGQGEQKSIKHGIRDDLETVKDTFDLSEVPKEPLFLGLAGTLPYFATSLSTVYLAWNLNTEWPTTSNFLNSILISHDTARHLLAVIEPIQLGYGAVIISFLGAVHWGMEYTEKTPDPARTRFRYGLGVLAPAVAWPTLLMPMDFALTAQFAAFVLLYVADSRATVRAWAPSWYATYRFVLTAIVGTALFISLIGRMKVGDAKPRLTGVDERLHNRWGEEDYNEKWEELERKDKEKMKKEKEAEEKKKEEEQKDEEQKDEKKDGDQEEKKGEEKKEGSDE
ncbi:uncharacterized protein F4812DRAFT_415469 [Daldinia caldariorum]|uniref:uncharacterized protein n=1 Tax=Daldinia caldariorum TaxID=326644 RepID=UPI0020072488|nr:uncharacterized protein F4812DRAFT_415469 [Daldinia caldariorum]KAI1471789.1 hypothetical protein F4812DRAFT_415469 [Daldinia caldariorum]